MIKFYHIVQYCYCTFLSWISLYKKYVYVKIYIVHIYKMYIHKHKLYMHWCFYMLCFFILLRFWTQFLWTPFLSVGHCLLLIRMHRSPSVPLFSLFFYNSGTLPQAFINGPSEGNPSLVASSGSHTQCWSVLLAYANKQALSSQWNLSQKHTSPKHTSEAGFISWGCRFLGACLFHSNPILTPKGKGLSCITWLIVEPSTHHRP